MDNAQPTHPATGRTILAALFAAYNLLFVIAIFIPLLAVLIARYVINDGDPGAVLPFMLPLALTAWFFTYTLGFVTAVVDGIVLAVVLFKHPPRRPRAWVFVAIVGLGFAASVYAFLLGPVRLS
ncbi:MAG: hypothetical protein K0S68_1024 [Candidatus Saccharibacteria bacterium]|nr:hypothetical protein [Candidatus Saccharibacteria bacterium]